MLVIVLSFNCLRLPCFLMSKQIQDQVKLKNPPPNPQEQFKIQTKHFSQINYFYSIIELYRQHLGEDSHFIIYLQITKKKKKIKVATADAKNQLKFNKLAIQNTPESQIQHRYPINQNLTNTNSSGQSWDYPTQSQFTPFPRK